MNKKRNKYWRRHKHCLQLKERLEQIRNAQRALGYVTLDVPIHIGYTARLALRKDVANREDAWVFADIIAMFGTTAFNRRRDGFPWLFKRKPRHHHRYWLRFEVNPPFVREISVGEYDSLDKQVAKHFSRRVVIDGFRSRIEYCCTVPSVFFEIAYEKEYRTEVKLFDEVLLQEEAEIEALLDDPRFYGIRYDQYNAPKHFRKHLNRSERRKLKRETDMFIKSNDDGVYYKPNYRGANWLWW